MKSLTQDRCAERTNLAWFISPHGFGHAARAAAIMEACSSGGRDLHLHLFTTVPQEFFADSLRGIPFAYHRVECDVGMVQENPLMEDVEGTIRALDRLPLEGGAEFDRLVERVGATGSRLIVCDIAPLGLAVARRLAVPGVLVENFTWDWIYRPYSNPGLQRFGDLFADYVSSAALRIQTEPVCRRVEGGRFVAPVSREFHYSREETRDRLDLGDDQPVLLLSQSGAGIDRRSLEVIIRRCAAMWFIVPDARVERVEVEGRLIRVPFFGSFYHPDLVQASDVVVAKLGYSTVAEAYHAATALAYVSRPHFPESPVLEAFVNDHIPSVALPEFWLEHPSSNEILERLIETSRPKGPRPNGASQAADLIMDALQLRF